MKGNSKAKDLNMKSERIPYDLWRCRAQFSTDLMFTAFLCLTLAGYFYKAVPGVCSKPPTLGGIYNADLSPPAVPNSADGNAAAGEALPPLRSYLWHLICAARDATCPATATDPRNIWSMLLRFIKGVSSGFVQVCKQCLTWKAAPVALSSSSSSTANSNAVPQWLGVTAPVLSCL
jgi:hypothetical protein